MMETDGPPSWPNVKVGRISTGKKISVPSRMEWLNKAWSIMLMYTISAIVQFQEGDRKARTDFQKHGKYFWTLGPIEILNLLVDLN